MDRRVAVDPGHPTHEGDPGAVSGSFREVDNNWDLANALKEAVHALGWPLEIMLTRRYNEVASLRMRAERADMFGAELFVSMHTNSSPNNQAHGARAFVMKGDPIAHHVAKAWLRSVPSRFYGDRDVIVLPDEDRYPRADEPIKLHKYPAVLWEHGFVSNALDLDEMLLPSVRDGWVCSGLCALAAWRRLVETQCKEPIRGYYET